jgi:hypothetical protein
MDECGQDAIEDISFLEAEESYIGTLLKCCLVTKLHFYTHKLLLLHIYLYSISYSYIKLVF